MDSMVVEILNEKLREVNVNINRTENSIRTNNLRLEKLKRLKAEIENALTKI